MKNADFKETLQILTSDWLFSGAYEKHLPKDTKVINDLELAMHLANEQHLPRGYHIWKDIQDNAVAEFRTTPAFDTAMQMVKPASDEVLAATNAVTKELFKKRLRKTITEYEDFIFTLFGDVHEQLETISVGQICRGEDLNPVLKDIRASYRCGFYPCGWSKKDRIVVFDPRTLDGHTKSPFAG